MGQLIVVREVVKRFNDLTAVDGVSFSVKKGECLGVLGPNGAGKTTIVRMIQCISPITSGEITVLCMKAQLSERKIRALLGVVPQENDVDPDLTVTENLELFAALFDIPKAIAKKSIKEHLEFVELIDKAKDKIDTLSGGMKRRFLIARALLNEPKIMILDEPTTGLDPQARHLIWQRLRSLRDQGVTMVLNTQYMEEAQQLCDRLLILDKGRILKEGVPKVLIKQEVGEEVVEIRDHGGVKNILQMVKGLAFTSETVGDTLYLYCHESKEIMTRLAGCETCSVLRRPATLEDVFLKLTGRGLNE
ncbi:MAG: ATP-binding cassette domain-containing protein [Candidatus Margulisbacteria bacterium]|nr:ATP-binding cassette domain-containing protein [Candidatus Margulisiibacteriota bacterium]